MHWDELEFFSSDKFRQIVSFLNEEEESGNTVYPPHKDILNAFAYTDFDHVKCVIIGQDPYHGPGQAHGLAFSVKEGVSLPPSLRNIYRELREDIGRNRRSGDLSDWAKHGVLLLNTSLTVVKGQANSHASIGWNILVNDVINALNEHRRNVVYILWGRHAQQYERLINGNNNLIIKSAHPSPLSASRGFFGSKPFSRTNKYLTKHNIEPIKW